MLRTSLGLWLLSLALVLNASSAFAQAPAAEAVDVHGASVHYTTAGGGATSLIFVHGWTCDESSWMRQVPEMTKAYRVVTIDLPGHGKSAASTDGVYSMARFAEAIEAVRVRERIDKAVLIGHSMGATVVTRYAQDFPGHASALVMVDGFLASPPVRVQLRTIAPAAQSDPKAREPMITSMFSQQTTPEDRAHILKMMLAPSTEVARGAMLGMVDDEAIQERPLDLPSHGIFAERERQPPLDYMKKILPAFTMETIKDAGHFLMLDQAAAFNQALLAYLHTLKP
jgi:pimeloyl-ACP methyl ester carboxylesterase